MQKTYVEPNALYRDSFRLARKIWRSGWQPDVILVMWRGGTPVGITIHEYFLFRGLKTLHAVIHVESYLGIGRQKAPVVRDIGSLLRQIPRKSRVLLVDDICDSGATFRHVRARLKSRTSNIRTAALFSRKNAKLKPDYHLRTTSRWIVFPHELAGLSPAEIRHKDPCLPALLAR
jgi:uncharacterized protein